MSPVMTCMLSRVFLQHDHGDAAAFLRKLANL